MTERMRIALGLLREGRWSVYHCYAWACVYLGYRELGDDDTTARYWADKFGYGYSHRLLDRMGMIRHGDYLRDGG